MKSINITTTLLALIAMLFVSCDSNKGKVEEQVRLFVAAVNNKDKATIYDIYPEAKNIKNMSLPDSIVIGEISVEKTDSSLYIASIANTRMQKLVFEVKGENAIVLKDTYSVLELDSAAMELAIQTGVPVKEISDLEISKLMGEEGDYIEFLKTMYADEIQGGLVKESGTWHAQQAYGGNVTVTQPIRNVGSVPIKGSEYNVEITFYSPNGTASAHLKKVENGVDLEPNEATTLYLYPGSGYVEACFAHDFAWTVSFVYKNQSPIGSLLNKAKLKGKEYDEFLKSKVGKEEHNNNDAVLNLNLNGTLGNANDAVFSYNGKKDEGKVTFTVNGTKNVRKLKLDNYDGETRRLIMKEFFQDGKEIGSFDGIWKDGIYEGKFTNLKGVTIDFKMKSTIE